MPRIVVTTEPTGSRSKAAVLLDERIVTADLASGHFAAQLIERIGWALLDADGTDQEPPRRVGPPGLLDRATSRGVVPAVELIRLKR